YICDHSWGICVDLNPLYNPYVAVDETTGEQIVVPAEAAAYADRTAEFAYKIDEDDLAYQLFTQHGFTWGGHWESVKDYQHFQKEID
ncbi:MAG: M15 family metallopeptidase, partial [Lachnospiraceae bacterium]